MIRRIGAPGLVCPAITAPGLSDSTLSSGRYPASWFFGFEFYSPRMKMKLVVDRRRRPPTMPGSNGAWRRRVAGIVPNEERSHRCPSQFANASLEFVVSATLIVLIDLSSNRGFQYFGRPREPTPAFLHDSRMTSPRRDNSLHFVNFFLNCVLRRRNDRHGQGSRRPSVRFCFCLRLQFDEFAVLLDP